MRTKLLNELKQAFQPYSPLWREWTKYKYNHLSEEEIYTLNIQIKNNFTVSIDEFVMFYNKIEILEGLLVKLKFFFDEFSEWVILKWQLNIFRLAITFEMDEFFKTSINDLDVSDELKDSLMLFGFDTLSDVFDIYSDWDFRNPRLFGIVLDNMKYIKKEKLILN